MNTDSTDWLEARRLRAWELKQEGWSQRKITEALGVSEGAVSQWMEAARDGGPVNKGTPLGVNCYEEGWMWVST